MARAASAPPSRPRRAAAAGMPERSAGMGSGTPITPVEATSTSSATQPMARATSDAVSRASARPASPVAAFAQPAFTTTARARPDATCSRETTTGAACARLVVKTAAAVHGPSATSSARSGPCALMPDATAAARNPSGAVTPLSPVAAGEAAVVTPPPRRP